MQKNDIAKNNRIKNECISEVKKKTMKRTAFRARATPRQAGQTRRDKPGGTVKGLSLSIFELNVRK
jgi:hypothetical protein